MDTPAIPRLRASRLEAVRPFLLPGAWPDPRVGIVHLGLGNFHRAHQAVYTEEAIAQAGGDWGICGVMMRGDVQRRQPYDAQDGLYTVLERGPQGTRARVIRALRQVLVAPAERDAVLARMRDPRVRIVSLTVTEKGYCLDGQGGLDLRRPEVVHDLAHPDAPVSVPGLLVAALRARRAQPFTVLSCDNLQHNGAALRGVVLAFARTLDAGLADWIAECVAFPSTMVDRITPLTTPQDLADAALHLGCEDQLPVPCEPFRQWVIEDRFPLGRPAWERAGARFVDSVAAFERAKLRMLNGSHSAIAYLSLLAGVETVDAAMQDGDLQGLVHAMMTEEIAPTLDMPRGFDLPGYRDALLARFANPGLRHRCAQIGADGSQKLPQRLLAPIAERLQAGAAPRRLVLAVAAWMRFLCGRSEGGRPHEVQDPLAERLTRLAHATQEQPAAMVRALLGVREVFPEALAAQAGFSALLHEALVALNAGVRPAIQRYR